VDGFRVKEFNKDGPAKAAGVDSQWILDVGHTLRLNPALKDKLQEKATTIEGSWRTQLDELVHVRSKTVAWRNGESAEIINMTATTIQMGTDDNKREGTLQDGKLCWSDGDTWLRAEALLTDPSLLLELDEVTLVFEHPEPQGEYYKSAFGSADNGTWDDWSIPASSIHLQFATDGDGSFSPEARWGIWALCLPGDAEKPSKEAIEKLASQYTQVSMVAKGTKTEPTVTKEDWDEARLRALCDRHGWEFEWMTEEGERKRRVAEKSGLFRAGSYYNEAVKAASKGEEQRRQQKAILEGGRPDGYVDDSTPAVDKAKSLKASGGPRLAAAADAVADATPEGVEAAAAAAAPPSSKANAKWRSAVASVKSGGGSRS